MDTDSFADMIKRSGKIKQDDILLIPAGTHFSYPVYQGQVSYTFSEPARVGVRYIDYDTFEIVKVDEDGNFGGMFMIEKRPGEYSCRLPKFNPMNNDERYSVPDWSQFRVSK